MSNVDISFITGNPANNISGELMTTEGLSRFCRNGKKKFEYIFAGFRPGVRGQSGGEGGEDRLLVWGPRHCLPAQDLLSPPQLHSPLSHLSPADPAGLQVWRCWSRCCLQCWWDVSGPTVCRHTSGLSPTAARKVIWVNEAKRHVSCLSYIFKPKPDYS